MISSRLLQEISKPRLRLLFLVFFVALLVPTLILVWQAYDRLKWEALYLNRNLARELTTRIDNRLSDVIDAEESRSFTDYGYLVVVGDPSANFLQPSPLSSYPVDSALPGLIGYFQVDPEGRFSTPLVPQQSGQAGFYGVTTVELAERRDLHDKIQGILSRNQLVQTPPFKEESLGERTDLSEERSAGRANLLSETTISDADRFSSAVNRKGAGPKVEPEAPTEMRQSMESDLQRDKLRRIESVSLDKVASSALHVAESANQAMQSPVGTQIAFDRLKDDVAVREKQKNVTVPDSLGRVADLSLEVRSDQDEQEEMEALRVTSPPKKSARVSRKEQSALPAEPSFKPDPVQEIVSRNQSYAGITLFESEVQPFDFSLLDSGHFVAYRQVWRAGQRYIQGAIIDQELFLSGIIAEAFQETALSRISNLIVAYYGNILSAFSGSEYTNQSISNELSGSLLYRNRLSAPFNDMQLVFSITRLPPGPGAAVLGWVASILGIVLFAGTYLMYRLGLRLIEVSSQQQDFVSSVSHELKTPLTSIRMYGEILREGWASEEKKKDYYQFIYEESERLTRLITNVLQLARMSRNELQVDMKPVSVDELMDGIRSKVSSQIEAAGFALNVYETDQSRGVLVMVDSDGFTQIMINLVDNAIKFTRNSSTRRIDLSARNDDGEIMFAVRDHGPGIAKDQLDKIFRLFYRSEDEITRETAGTGIGLALVHQLAQSMGGRVEVVNSDPGAEFRVFFDVIRTKAPGRI